MMTVDWQVDTDGNGLWTSHARTVCITGLSLLTTLRQNFGELRVFFDTRSWNVEQHGLIYTDPLFLYQLRLHFDDSGLCGSDVEYSEQGMQGADYVSLEVYERFVSQWSEQRLPMAWWNKSTLREELESRNC